MHGEVSKTTRRIRVRLVRRNPTSQADSSHTEGAVKAVTGNRRGENNKGNSEHMKKIRAMRSFYGKQTPPLQCSTCAYAQVCPKYRAGYECAFTPFLKSHKIRNEQDLEHYMKEFLSAQMQRVHQELLMERLAGGKPSLETSESLSMTFAQMKQFADYLREKNTSVLEVEAEQETIVGRLFKGIDTLLEETKEASKVDNSFLPGADEKPAELEAPKVNQELVLDYTKHLEKL